MSLYFKSQSETTQAVVTNLRANGFWVYVPQFDIRGPVYLCDASGNVQIDPLLLKLDPSAGQPPTIGFSGSGSARMFASGRCSLINSPDEHLEVVVSEFKSSYVVRVLDVVTVKICCDNWDTRARVPLPRLHLIGASSAMKKAANEKRQPTKSEITSSTLASPAIEIRNFGAKRKVQVARSIYDETLSLYTPPVLSDVPYRTREKRNESEGRATATMAGRIIYGGFRNPDTQQAKQEVLIAEASDAAQQRRNQAIANMTRNNEFNTTQSIEKDATARMQRLVASKRNTRKAKGK